MSQSRGGDSDQPTGEYLEPESGIEDTENQADDGNFAADNAVQDSSTL